MTAGPPPTENDTEAYIQAVAKSLKVLPDSPVEVTDPKVMETLLTAIIRHENGLQPYAVATIRRGMALAGIKQGA